MLQRIGQFRVVSRAAAAELRDCAADGIGLVLLNVNSARAADPVVVNSIALVRQHLPGAAIVLLAEREEPEQALEAIRLGASAYLPTSLSPEVAIAALRLVLAGGTYVPAAPVQESAPDGAPPASAAELAGVDDLSAALGLTPRELEVLLCVQQGRANKLIAYALGISEHTVKVHLRRIMRKLKATNRTEAAAIAFERIGRVPPAPP